MYVMTPKFLSSPNSVIQTIIMLFLAFIIFYLVIYNKSLSLEKRIAKYGIESISEKSVSFFDLLYMKYLTLLKNISSLLNKSIGFRKYSKRFENYISYDNPNNTIAMDYISNKFLIAIVFVIIMLLGEVIAGTGISSFSLIIAFLIGFFVLDVYFFVANKMRKKKVEQDLLNAIIIMNNAFRSGRSTIQAIEIVADELDGPIKQEFKKMHLEISYGLSLETVFDRFSKRVSSEEVSYITSSLTILNKTGGNIINVFSSIEKLLFDKRKLHEEMQSLTSSSRMICKILLAMPVIFIIIIYALNNSYFNVLFTTNVGHIILIVMLLLYVVYAFVVDKVMKVRS